jgi:hypothetical protein
MTGPWNILRHVNIWSAVTRKDGDGGGGGGNDNDSGSSSKGKFEDSRSELEAKGYSVSDDGKSVYNDNGQVAGEGWSGSRTVDDIVSGGGGGGGGDSGGGQSFREAFAAARAAKGPGQTFTWNGQVYTTNTAEEEQAAADAQAEANRKALLEAQMEKDRKTRAASEAAAVEADRIAKEEAAARMEAEAEAAAAEQERLRLEEAAASFEEEAEAADIDRLPDVMTVPDFGDSDTEGLLDFQEQQDQAYQDMLDRAKAAEELRTMPGQTSRATQFMARYGYDPNDLTAARIAKATPQELADLALATGRTDLTLLLLEQAPGAVLPPIGGGTAVAVGDAPAGTGVTSPEDIYMADEVRHFLGLPLKPGPCIRILALHAGCV